MFQRMIDDFRDSLAASIRQTSLLAAMALTIFVTILFLCAAAFVYVLQTYGLVQACLSGAGVFFVVTLVVAMSLTARKKRVRAQAAENRKSAMQSALSDPMLVATGIQLIRAIGIKRLVPILAIGGLALGFLASRGAAAPDNTSSKS